MSVTQREAVLQGTCAFEAQNVIKLLTFDQVDKDKAAGRAATELSARLADLIQDYHGAPWAHSSLMMPCTLCNAPALHLPT